jgi:DNA-binding beta-propeller fold protein YncE
VLAAVAALAALRTGGGDEEERDRPALAIDAARNNVVALDRGGARPEAAVPLPGRPTDVTAVGDTVWIATVDATGVTAVDARTRAITRTVLLSGSPDAIAAGEGSIWVADSRRGTVTEVEAGYDRIVRRIALPPAPRRGTPRPGVRPRPRSGLAVAAGAVWVTNGSSRLTRVEAASGAVRRLPAGAALHAVAAGAGAVWALSSTASAVLRVDPASGAITDRIPIARPGAESPFPIGIAAGTRSVWVLNANTATLTQIDARTRGVVTTVPIGVDRVPTDVAAAGETVWVANGDGSASRVDTGAAEARTVWVGESLERVAAAPGRVWLTTTAIEQNLGGGDG